jgi:hypothetical protein
MISTGVINRTRTAFILAMIFIIGQPQGLPLLIIFFLFLQKKSCILMLKLLSKKTNKNILQNEKHCLILHFNFAKINNDDK